MSRIAKEKTRSRKNNKRMASAKSESKLKKKVVSATSNRELLSYAKGLVSGFDLTILVPVLALSIFGIAMVFSAGYYSTVNSTDPDPLYYLTKQAEMVAAGLVLLVACANFDYHKYYKYANILMIVSLALLIMVALVGVEVNGARRQLYMPFFNLTPSEVSKFFLVIYTAVFFAGRPGAVTIKKGLWIPMLVAGIHFLLIFKQPNLSTAIVVFAIMFGIMLVAGISPMWVVGLIGTGAIGAFCILKFVPEDHHWHVRLTNWIDPFADSQNGGYQVVQSIIALGNGGVKGLGFGKSISKNLYLPEPQNDFILAVIGEELGFIGFLILMIVYIFLLYRLIMVALNAKDRLGCYMATGVAVMLGLQVIINVAVVTSSMPATGITLPFVSFGGSSMCSFMASIGLVLNISRKKQPERVRK